jgi:hypothetical protein
MVWSALAVTLGGRTEKTVAVAEIKLMFCEFAQARFTNVPADVTVA